MGTEQIMLLCGVVAGPLFIIVFLVEGAFGGQGTRLELNANPRVHFFALSIPIEFLLRTALADAGRFPGKTKPLPRRGRPPRTEIERDTMADALADEVAPRERAVRKNP